MSRVLITGAGGLVGSALLSLFGPDDEVHAVVRAKAPAVSGPRLQVHAVDLAGPVDTSGFPKAIDADVYLAQSENFCNFPKQARDIFDVTVASLLRTLDYARRAGAGAFVMASSGGVHGSSASPLREDASISATGSLGFDLSSKLCGEILCGTFAPYMNIAILRLFFAYGPGQRRNMLIPRLIESVRETRPILLRCEQEFQINPIHAADAAAAMELSGLNKINVAGPEVMSLREICERIGRQVGRRPIFDVRDGTPDADLIADISVMTRLLGAPQRRLADTLQDLL